jgi:hypothetical protein
MVIPWLQFHSKSIILYNEYVRDNPFFRTHRQRISAEKLLQQKTYTGILCKGARKRLTKALENIIQYSTPKDITRENGHKIKFRVNFITLTIYSYGRQVPGKEASKNILEPFLRWLRDNYYNQIDGKKELMYLWKAELQANRQDCQQLHYHLTTDVYIPREALTAKWNELQKKHGYLDTFFEKYGHWNPPSTKIHALYKKRDPVSYIKKQVMNYSDYIESHMDDTVKDAIGEKPQSDYTEADWDIVAEISKDLQNRFTVGGKVWDCSLNLKAIDYYKQPLDNAVEDVLDREIEAKNCTAFKTDHCTIFKFKAGPAYQVLNTKDRAEYFKIRNNLFAFERKPPDKKVEQKPVEQWNEVKKVNINIQRNLFSKN